MQAGVSSSGSGMGTAASTVHVKVRGHIPVPGQGEVSEAQNPCKEDCAKGAALGMPVVQRRAWCCLLAQAPGRAGTEGTWYSYLICTKDCIFHQSSNLSMLQSPMPADTVVTCNQIHFFLYTLNHLLEV